MPATSHVPHATRDGQAEHGSRRIAAFSARPALTARRLAVFSGRTHLSAASSIVSSHAATQCHRGARVRADQRVREPGRCLISLVVGNIGRRRGRPAHGVAVVVAGVVASAERGGAAAEPEGHAAHLVSLCFKKIRPWWGEDNARF